MSEDNPIIPLAPFSAQAVADHYGILPEETVLRAAVQSLYNFMSGAPRFNEQSRMENNLAATEETILALQFRLPALRAFEDNFFGDDDYDRDGMIVAAICSNSLDATHNDYDHMFFINLMRLDPSLEDRAAFIRDEAARYLHDGLQKDEVPSKEALFLAHLEAYDTLRAALFDFNRGTVDMDFMYAFQDDNELLQTVPTFLVNEAGISAELYATMKEVYEIYGMHVQKADIVQFPGKPPEPTNP